MFRSVHSTLLIIALLVSARFECSHGIADAAYPELTLHQLTLKELQSPSESTLKRLRQAIFQHGMFVVLGADSSSIGAVQPSVTSHRSVDVASSLEQPFQGALGAFATCAQNSQLRGLLREVQMQDGVTRRTLATSTNHSVPQPYPAEVQQYCPALSEPAEELRKTVDATGRAYASLLDSLLHGDSSSSSSFQAASRHPFSDAVRDGESLEHFHLFQQASSQPVASLPQQDGSGATLPLHTDMGLFLVMTAAEYFSVREDHGTAASPRHLSQGLDNPGIGLVLELPDRQRVQPVIPEGSLLVMNGEASQRWLWPGRDVWDLAGELPFAPGHEMTMPRADGIVRAWFGRMYFPPRDAVHHQDNRLTFGQYRDQTHAAFRAGKPELASILGCSPTVLRLNDESSCADDEVYCWMTCMPMHSDLGCPKAEVLCENPAGQIWPADFINPGTGQPEHCSDCGLVCPGAAPPEPSTGFCNERLVPITMWMTGFKFSSRSTDPCVVFLFQGCVLNTGLKFSAACGATLLMGVMTLGFSYVILCIRKGKPLIPRPRKPALAGSKVNGLLPDSISEGSLYSLASSGGPKAWGPLYRPKKPGMRILRVVLLVTLYATQITFAYWLMLLAMTYQAELFIMVVFGLAIGFWLFNLAAEEEEVDNPDPCCV